MLIKWFLLIYSYLSFYGKADDEVQQDYASSVARASTLLYIERFLINGTLESIAQLRKRLQILEGLLQNIEAEHIAIAADDAEGYVSNPLHNFALIRRLYIDWPNMLEYMTIDSVKDLKEFYLPTTVDIEDAVKGLRRIQFYYQMNPKYLAEGFDDNYENDMLRCRDLQQISSTLFDLNFIEDAELWLQVAFEKCSQREKTEYFLDKEIYKFEIVQLYELYAKVLLSQAKVEEALEISKTALQLYPFSKQLRFELQIENILNSKIKYLNYTQQSSIYEDLKTAYFVDSCRSESYPSSRHLSCRLTNHNSLYYILAPFKVEVLNLAPFVAVYHDIVPEYLMHNLRERYFYSLVHAKVIDFEVEGGVKKFEGRKAHTNFIYDELAEKMANIVSDLSGLNKEGFEALSLINYGIGGHYESHTDNFFGAVHNSTGDRLATALIYLNDVESGGHTTFYKLNLSVPPRKGSILFWHNLKHTGEPHPTTEHGACPTIVGSKWVGTIWIHYAEQIFHRPCNINENWDY